MCGRRFRDKVTLITGAASGIGRATALMFAREGASVALLDRNAEGLQAVADEVEQLGQRPLLVATDLEPRENCADAVKRTVESFGRIDVLSNSAVVAITDPLMRVSPEDWDTAFAVNLAAPLWLARAAVEHMPTGSSIINTSSLSGARAAWGGGPYAVTKAALNMLTRVLARELGPRGIRVNAVLPAQVATGLGGQPEPGDETYETWAEGVRRSNPLGRLAVGEDIARVILFLASDEAAHITGAEIVADAGFGA